MGRLVGRCVIDEKKITNNMGNQIKINTSGGEAVGCFFSSFVLLCLVIHLCADEFGAC